MSHLDLEYLSNNLDIRVQWFIWCVCCSKRIHNDDPAEDEKRQKFLERNRCVYGQRSTCSCVKKKKWKVMHHVWLLCTELQQPSVVPRRRCGWTTLNRRLTKWLARYGAWRYGDEGLGNGLGWWNVCDTRCRQRTDDGCVMLQKENSRLRDEVSQLKTLLLAHTDCPVTQLQLHAGQLFINGGETKYLHRCAEFLLITVAMTTRCIIIVMCCVYFVVDQVTVARSSQSQKSRSSGSRPSMVKPTMSIAPSTSIVSLPDMMTLPLVMFTDDARLSTVWPTNANSRVLTANCASIIL